MAQEKPKMTLKTKKSGKLLDVLEDKFDSSGAKDKAEQMMQKGARLVLSAEIWRNAIPTRHCDVLLTFPSRLPNAKEIVSWIMDQIRRKDHRIRFECRFHTQLQCYAIYCTARYENILRGAELLQMKKRLKDDFGGGLREFCFAEADCFEGVDRKLEFLNHQERAVIVKSFLFAIRAQENGEILRSPRDTSTNNDVIFSIREGQAIVPALLSKGLINSIQALHNTENLRPLQEWVTQPLETLCLEKVEKYFGTQIAMYFAWLNHYTVGLIFPAIIGLSLFYFGIETIGFDQTTGESQLASDVCFVLFALFNCLWATVFLESWKRRQGITHKLRNVCQESRFAPELAFQWGTLGMEEDLLVEPRPMFQGELARSPITGRLEPHYPPWRRRMVRYFFSAPSTVVCILIMFCAMLAVFELQEWTTKKFGESSIFYFITFIPKILLAVLIALSDFAYTRVAVRLNDLENYRNEDAYENQLIVKIAIFQFVNSFLSLFYIGFYLKDMKRLREQLAALLITRQVIGNCQEAVVPWILDRIKLSQMAYKMTKSMSDASLEQHISDIKEQARISEEKILRASSIEQPDSPVWTPESELRPHFSIAQSEETELRCRTGRGGGTVSSALAKPVTESPHLSVPEYRGETGTHLTQAELESMLAKYTSPLEDYLEMFIQFGYVLLFSPAFPLAAVWALANNLFEVRVDTFKLTTTLQRPFARRVQDIGSWMPAMELMGVLGVMVNCALIGQSGLVQRFWPDISWGGQILIVVVLEHLILAVKFIIAVAIPDVPNWVTVKMGKVEFKRREALRLQRRIETNNSLPRDRLFSDSPPQDERGSDPQFIAESKSL